MINRRRPWHQRLLRCLTRRSIARAYDTPGSRAVSPVFSLLRHPSLACAVLYFLAAAAALACAAWTPALVLALASVGCFLCYHRRLSNSPQSACFQRTRDTIERCSGGWFNDLASHSQAIGCDLNSWIPIGEADGSKPDINH